MLYPDQNRIYPGYTLIETQFRKQLISRIGAVLDRECMHTSQVSYTQCHKYGADLGCTQDSHYNTWIHRPELKPCSDVYRLIYCQKSEIVEQPLHNLCNMNKI